MISKFEAFCSTIALRGVLGSGAAASAVAASMDQHRIILVDLSKRVLGEPASRLLAFLHLNRARQAALRCRTVGTPFTIMVDEAHAVTAGGLTAMLSEGCTIGEPVVLAHQFFDQLDESLHRARPTIALARLPGRATTPRTRRVLIGAVAAREVWSGSALANPVESRSPSRRSEF